LRDVADERHQRAVDEDRRDDGDVGGVVLARPVRVVDDVGVAGRHPAGKRAPDLVDLRAERTDVQGLRHALRHHAAVPVENREGEILAFLDDGRIAGPQHVQGQLARDLVRRLMNDLEIDGVHAGVPIPATPEREQE
jgi:hypothetical protein